MFQWLTKLKIGFLHARAGSTSRDVLAHEKECALTVPALIANDYNISMHEKYESWIYRSYSKNSEMIKYTYDCIADSPDLSNIFLVTRIEREPTPEAAKLTFEDAIKDYSSGVETRNSRFIFKGNLKTWCDNSFASFIINDDLDDISGCVFVFQKNNLIYSIITSGLIFEEKEEINELLYPLLDKAEKWASQTTMKV